MIRLIIGVSAIAITSQATISPGQWVTTSTLVDLEAGAGMPPGAAEMMREVLGSEGITTETCVTREQLARGPQDLFNQTDGDCAYESFSMDDGEVEMVAQCAGPAGPMRMTMNGTYTSTTYSTTMEMEGDGGMGRMTMVFTVEGRRTGSC